MGKTCIIAEFLRTDLVICSHSREGETQSYSQINTVNQPLPNSSNKHHLGEMGLFTGEATLLFCLPLLYGSLL